MAELQLLIPSDETPPLSVLAVARVAGVPLTIHPTLTPSSPPVLVLTNGLKLRGGNVVIRYLGRTSTAFPSFYQRDAIETAQIDEWLEYASIFSSGSEYEGACKYVDGYLLHHTFLVGQSLSVGDIVVWSYLAGAGKRWESLMKSKKYQNLVRWYTMISTEHAAVLDQLTAAYTKKKDSAPVKTKEIDQGLNANKQVASSRPEVDLPYAEMGKVCLRFAPEPSGYLHIGHSKAALMNQHFAQRYNGIVIVRFDDTNPAKESNEFVDNLLIDIRTLGINYEKVTYTSDYFPQLMEMAEKLIKEGKAYVDDTPREQMQKERMDGIDSKCRNNSVDENLKLWKEMISGSERGLQCCVRGKLDMQDPNKSLRDPVYYRCNPMPHHRIGSKYKIYPTYDFACPFVDSIEGITHALRSSEYHDRNAQYYRIQEDMGLRKVHIYEFSRLNMVYTLLSKRKLLWFVQNGKVDGWDDARFPTVQGIVRRGLQIEALIQFILEQGASKNLNLMEWDKLWNINKKIIDPVCPRHTAILEDGRVLLTLTNGPDKPFVRVVPKHKHTLITYQPNTMNKLNMADMLGHIGSILASVMFVWAIIQQYFPHNVRNFFDKYSQRFLTLFYPFIQITFNEFTGERFKRSEAYSAIETYLSKTTSMQAKRLKADVIKNNTQPLSLSMDDHEEVADDFNGVKVYWSSGKNILKTQTFSFYPSTDEKRYYKLTFHKRYRETIIGDYLKHVLKEGREIKVKNRLRKLYTNNGAQWSHVVFEHPASFKTLAMDPVKKQEIIDDLTTFSNGEEFYNRIGRAWKRGYLLYGPPGTGKSTMIAAMANFLCYDIYDLELTAVKDNTELRRLLIETSSKSIIVIEDIDCSMDLTGQRKKEVKEEEEEGEKKAIKPQENEAKASKVTLSGLLNFVDGLWSACGGDRLIVFTTNHVEKLDPALIRRGRMDKHIELGYCGFEGFKVLASNYLCVEKHELFDKIRELLGEVEMTPADVAENLMPKTSPPDEEGCLKSLIEALEMAKEEAARKKAEEEEEKKKELMAVKIDAVKVANSVENGSV